jgi:hypothetical protein
VASSLPRAERLALVDQQDPVVSARTQATLVGLARSGLYYRPVAPKAAEVAISIGSTSCTRRIPIMVVVVWRRSYGETGCRSIARRCSGTCERWILPASRPDR